MNKRNKLLTGLLVLIVTVPFLSMTLSSPNDTEPWEVPAKYKTMKNPNKISDESLKIGQMLYTKNCSSCHGKTGKGDGVKARTLETFPGDFSSADYKNQTDGEKFYKSKIGRDEMPKFEGKIPDEDIWNIVSFMNTMAK